MAGHAAAYDEFLYSFNGRLEFRDDLDLDAYGRATATERGALDRLLEQKLPEGDPRVARAVGALWPADKASAALTRALASAGSDARLDITRALRSVSNDAALSALRTAFFDENASTEARMHAAGAIAEIDGAPASISLKAALDEPPLELQRYATELLLRRYGLDEAAAAGENGAAVLRRLLAANDESVRAPAVAELKRVVDSGSAGLDGYAMGNVPPTLAAIARDERR